MRVEVCGVEEARVQLVEGGVVEVTRYEGEGEEGGGGEVGED